MVSLDTVPYCPRCNNILSCENRTYWCAHCKALIEAYCVDTNTDPKVIRRILIDTDSPISKRLWVQLQQYIG